MIEWNITERLWYNGNVFLNDLVHRFEINLVNNFGVEIGLLPIAFKQGIGNPTLVPT